MNETRYGSIKKCSPQEKFNTKQHTCTRDNLEVLEVCRGQCQL